MVIKNKIYPFISTALCGALLVSACGIFSACGGVDCTFKLVYAGEEVEIHSELQEDYLSGPYTEIGKYAKGTQELSKPNDLRLSWTATDSSGAEPSGIDAYTVELSTDENFTSPITAATFDNYLNVSNLMVGTEYYWRVTAEFMNGKKATSKSSSFTTLEGCPRNMNVAGVTNMRDLGGWMGTDGPVKQGLIYRCGRLSDNTTGTVSITSAGIKTMTKTLKIKSEVDLRRTDNNENGGLKSSPLGASAKYVSFPIGWSTVGELGQGGYLSEKQEGYAENRRSVAKFFEFASIRSNYPMIFHCSIGTDRTGMMAYFFLGLLGVSEEDIYRDYCFSNFGNIGGARKLSDIQNGYIADVKKCDGDTLAEKINNYLVSVVGVKQQHIDGVIDILKAD